jgi:hypothetical protein
MTERRDARQQRGRDSLAGNEELDRLDPRPRRRVDEILALDGEQPRLLAVLARAEELADELELLVVPRSDQAALEPESASSAAFARSAIAANAVGSVTARSASDFRSSSIPALRTPAMNLL